MFDLKNTEEFSFITLKGDAKFEEKLTCGLENKMRYHFVFLYFFTARLAAFTIHNKR